ncbi:MAG: peroxiredoxin [Bryobacteraceae bacterium]
MIAPDFTLPSTTGAAVNLYQLLEKQPVVLFFYLRAFTPVCTSEACSFQNQLPSFQELNAAILGISSDSETVARKFAETFKLKFPLLLDPGGKVRKLYNIPKFLGLLPGRSTYVISQDKTVAYATHSQLGSRVHVEESLRFLQTQK